MGYSFYIGRVGALAVALGVGFAVGSPAGIGWAETTDATSPSAGSDISSSETGPQAAAVDTTAGDDGPPQTQGSQDGPAEPTEPSAAPEPTSSSTGQTVEVAPGVVVSSSGGAQSSGDDEPDYADDEDTAYGGDAVTGGTPATTTADRDTTTVTDEPADAPTTELSAQTVRTVKESAAVGNERDDDAVAVTASAVDINRETASVTLSAPPTQKVSTAPVVASPVTTINAFLQAFAAPILTSIFGVIPGIPANSPLGWLLLGAARRELAAPAEARLITDTSPTLTSLTATAVNLPPTVEVTLGTPVPTTGTVTGQVVATDPEGAALTYSVTAPPSSGSFVFENATRKFTYTPTTAQRILAAATSTTADTIAMTITVSDGTNKVPTVVNIPVSEAPLNKAGEIGSSDAQAVAVAGTSAFVANKAAGTVTVIDTVTNTAVRTIAVGANPDGIAVNPAGTRLYVSSTVGNTVKAVNISTGKVIRTLSIANPSAIAMSASGNVIYVASHDAGTVKKINTSYWTISTVKLPTGSRPTDLVVSPDKTKIYVLSTNTTGGGSVAVFGSSSTRATVIANLADAPTDFAISADNKRLYVGAADSKLRVFDTATRAVIATHGLIGVPADVVLSKDGSTLLVTNTTGTVSAHNSATGALLGTLATRTSTTAVSVPPTTAVTADGTKLYVTDYDGDKVHVVSLVPPPNAAPQVGVPVLSAPDAMTGAVTGKVTSTDPDGDALKHTLTTAPTKGTVSLATDGTFTYTPTATARHAAAKVGATTDAKTDTFTVTVSDTKGASALAAVTVNILPANAVPVATVTVNAPNSTTGVVTGSVTATDADNDVRTYTSATAPTKGTVVLNSSTGAFTYTPTAAARHAAAKLGATADAKADTFTVKVDDGHGGTVTATVTVTISPANAAPSTPTVVSSTDTSTGVVTGTVRFVDADNDPLTYTATSAGKGTLTMRPDGGFTYTPTAAARQAAAAPGAAESTKTDTVTVTVADGYGGTATMTLTLTIAPALGSFEANDPTLAIGAVTGQVTGSNTQTGPLTYTVVAGPTKGLVKVDATTGTFVYVPNVEARYAAEKTPGIDTDLFTVAVTDTAGAQTSVTVTVQVAPPQAGMMDQRSTTIAVTAQEMYFFSQAETDMALDLLKQAGVTNIRILVPWMGVEYLDDWWTWEHTDRMVNGAAARDIEVLAVLNSPPIWASVPDVPILAGKPADPAEFAEYAGMVATRYAGKISAYEVWNEPNYWGFWAPGPNAAEYTELLKAAYPVIKAADPNAVVVAASVASVLDWFDITVNPVRFVEEMYAAGAAGYFDAIAFHPYLYSLPFSQGATTVHAPLWQANEIYKLMVANGDGNKKIWATEYGQPSHLVSEASQAEYVADFLRTWRTLPYAGPAFIHTIKDTTEEDPNAANMGLFRADWTPKQAWWDLLLILEENRQILLGP